MTNVHIIPVGFDHDRLLAPLSQGELDADRVILITGEEGPGDGPAETVARKMLRRVEHDIELLLDVDIETQRFSSLHDFGAIYQNTYSLIRELSGSASEIWVNVSSAPRPVAFGFSSVLHSLAAEDPERRGDLHLYYVPPESYLVTNMIDQLQQTEEELRRSIRTVSDHISGGVSASGSPRDELQDLVDDLIDRRDEIAEIVETIDHVGVTIGARETGGMRYMELPLALLPGLKGARASSGLGEVEIKILQELDNGAVDSLAALADNLADRDDVMGSARSLQSKVQYNVTQLEQKGFVLREPVGRGHKTELSVMGEQWVEANDLQQLLRDVREERRRRRAGQETETT